MSSDAGLDASSEVEPPEQDWARRAGVLRCGSARSLQVQHSFAEIIRFRMMMIAGAAMRRRMNATDLRNMIHPSRSRSKPPSETGRGAVFTTHISRMENLPKTS